MRLKSVQGLDKLVKLTTRLDPLVNELLSPISTSESNAIKTSALEALTVVLNRGIYLRNCLTQWLNMQ